MDRRPGRSATASESAASWSSSWSKSTSNSKLASSSFIDDVNVASTTIISLGKKADNVLIAQCHLSGDLEVLMGGGNDLFDLDFFGLAAEASQFDGNVNVLGGAGMDTLDELAANVFAIPPSYREFEVFV